MTLRYLMLASTGLALVPGTAGFAQTTAPVAGAAAPEPAANGPAGDEEGDGQEIVVTGQRPRGSVVGDIPAENVLSSRDVRATGATSIQELLAAIAPQTGSARGRGGGGGPVLLLGGQRISGFGEIRDLPPEAIERLEILPEEVALKYGYSADQRVVNIVLRRRFNSTATRADVGAATDGGYVNGVADLSRLQIGTGGRTQITLRAEGNDALGEADRDIDPQLLGTRPAAIDPRDYRTLIGSQTLVRGNVTANRTVLGDVSATLTAEASHSEGRRLFGVPTGTLAGPAMSPFASVGPSVLRGFPDAGALTRNTTSDSATLGLSMNWTKARWRYSVLANGDVTRNVTGSDRGPDLAAVQTRISANDPTLDPLGDVGTLASYARDRSSSTRTSAGIDGTANGPLLTLPAGRANVTVKAGVDTLALDSFARRAGVTSSADLKRDHATGRVNVDLPITRRNGFGGAIGSLTLNANAQVEHFSDFGTLTTYGGGANWSPAPRLNLITSWTRDEGAPSINNLGDPIVSTPGVRQFDTVTGQTVLVTATNGGNPALLADRRSAWKLGGNWQPSEKTDLKLRADYVRSTLTNPVQTFPGPSRALEAAFPGRFTRDGTGNLTAIDFRPVNYDRARSETLRIGFDFTKPLKSRQPSQSALDELRKQFQARRAAAGEAPPQPGDGGRPSGGREGGGFGPGGGGRGGGGFGGGGFGGGNQRGRLTFSLTDTITLVDKAIIRPGIAPLDFLNGDASGGGSGGGRSRHLVEAQAGYSNNGLGLRLSANYARGTRVLGGQNGDLQFSPLTTFDLRAFANLGENIDNVVRHPWMRGASIRVQVSNVFNARQKVRDAAGAVPFSYQPDFINPLGRTISISIRKLFIPSRFVQRPRSQPTS